MSTVSFIDRAAEEWRQGLVVGRVVLHVIFVGARASLVPILRLELVEHGIDRLIGIGGFALPLHRVQIVHIGLIGLFIVAEQTHRKSRTLAFDAFSSREPVPTSLEN